MPIILKKRPRIDVQDAVPDAIPVQDDAKQELARRFNDLESDPYTSTLTDDAAKTKPKVATPKRAPKTKQVTVKSAPPPRFTDATLRCVFAEASLMTRTLARMGTIGPNLVLDFAPSSSPDGLSMTLMHTSEVMMARLRMPKSAFLSYAVERATSYSLHFEQVRSLTKAPTTDNTLTFL